MTATALARTDERAEAQRLFRQVMGLFATGVTVVTTRLHGETFGMTANAFMAGSLEPMLCVVSINHTAQMHGRLRAAGHYGVSFLTEDQQHVAAHFAGKGIAGLAPNFELRGRTPILERAAAAVTADVIDTAECGDHTLFVGRITSLSAGDAAQPLLFYGGRYARLDCRATFGSPGSAAALDTVALPQFW